MKIQIKKLTDQQIIALETWAENKRKMGMNETEKEIVNSIDQLKKDNWKNHRIESKVPSTKEEAQKEFELLKRKNNR